MDDFIDKVAWGLNAAFSNGYGFPKTRWLFFDGARDELAFKQFLRSHQHPTEVWFSAYPQPDGAQHREQRPDPGRPLRPDDGAQATEAGLRVEAALTAAARARTRRPPDGGGVGRAGG